MSTTTGVRGDLVSGRTRRRRAARLAVVVAAAVGGGACGETTTEVVGPPVPGSIALTTVTTGFMKDDGYELLMNGESRGSIGANDAVTISELAPATYEFALADVADNCVVEAVSVEVVSEQTATAVLAVVCAPGDPSANTIRASRDRPDLDSGTVVECTFGLCPSDEDWDFFAEFDSQSDPQAIIRQNPSNGAQLAYVSGVALADLTEADVDGALFTTEEVDEPFGPSSVVLIRTDVGALYALGNPVETTLTLQLTYDALLLEPGQGQ